MDIMGFTVFTSRLEISLSARSEVEEGFRLCAENVVLQKPLLKNTHNYAARYEDKKCDIR